MSRIRGDKWKLYYSRKLDKHIWVLKGKHITGLGDFEGKGSDIPMLKEEAKQFLKDCGFKPYKK